MKQIENISLERMNNGAHYLYLTNVMAHADADEKVKTATTALLATLRSAWQAEDESVEDFAEKPVDRRHCGSRPPARLPLQRLPQGRCRIQGFPRGADGAGLPHAVAAFERL